MQGLRTAGAQHVLPKAFLARAEYFRLVGDWSVAWSDLFEAYEIAKRNEMRLHLADLYLEMARLSLAMSQAGVSREGFDCLRTPEEHLSIAKVLIKEMSYRGRYLAVEEMEKLLDSRE